MANLDEANEARKIHEISHDDLPKNPESSGFEGFLEVAKTHTPSFIGLRDHKILEELAIPIDAGADKLLLPYVGDPLAYTPLQIEYLTRTLTEHIRNCLELRRQGQELEISQFNQALGLLVSGEKSRVAVEHSKLSEASRPFVVSTMYNPGIDKFDGSISSRNDGPTYSSEVAKIERAYISINHNEKESISGFASLEGGAANYADRIRLIRELFEHELTEAYLRARSVFSGIRHCYPDIIDDIKTIPPLTPTGFLDALALWSKRAAYRLEKAILERRETTIALVLAKAGASGSPAIVPGIDFELSRKSGHYTFVVNEALIEKVAPGLKAPLLRSVELAVWGSARDKLDSWEPMRANISLPPYQVLTPEGAVGFSSHPTIHIPAVSMLNRRDYAIASQDQVHNVAPMGNWEIEIGQNNLFAGSIEDDTKLSAVVIFLRLFHK